MAEENLFPPSEETKARAWIDSMDQYKQMYRESIEDPEGFWAEKACLGPLRYARMLAGRFVDHRRLVCSPRSIRIST